MSIMQLFGRNKNKKPHNYSIPAAQSGEAETNGSSLTSAKLAEFNSNPLLFRHKELGLVPDLPEKQDDVVCATRMLILQGREVFARTYVVGGPIDKSTGKPCSKYSCKFEDWAKAQDKSVLHDDDAAVVEKMAASVRAHTHASALLSRGEPNKVVRCLHADADCEASLDWVNPERGIVAIDVCHSLDMLKWHAQRMGRGLAFDHAIYASLTGDIPGMYIISIERVEPFRCGVSVFTPQALATASKRNEEDITRLIRCRQSNTWLTGYENILSIDSID